MLSSLLIQKIKIDEQKILKNNGKLFLASKRIEAIRTAENENYKIAIFDDGLQEKKIDYDLKIVCFKKKKWNGKGQLITS